MFWTAHRKSQVEEAKQRTYELLGELGHGKYKTVRKLTFLDMEGTADCSQVDGQQGKHTDVRLFGGDPANKIWAIAHELGHGVHELYRGSRDTCGESWAEAIRYFAEKRFNPDSAWLKTGPPSQDRIVLDACGWDWGRFKEMFSAHLLPS